MAYRNDLTARELRRTGQFGRVLCAVLASGYILAVVILPNGLASAPDRGTPSKQSADSQSTRANSPNPQTAAKKELTFRPNGNSDVYDPYGSSLFVSQSFEASNGEWAELYWRRFDSSTDTIKYVKLHMEGVTKVLERKPKFNDRGEKIGERIVGVRLDHGPQSSGKPYTFVISTDGKFYQIVSAQSLGTVLAFEKFVENSQGSARVSPGR